MRLPGRRRAVRDPSPRLTALPVLAREPRSPGSSASRPRLYTRLLSRCCSPRICRSALRPTWSRSGFATMPAVASRGCRSTRASGRLVRPGRSATTARGATRRTAPAQGGPPSMSRASAAFYCVADERYFLGAVAMINSLRLNGHREPIYLLDCRAQRRPARAARRRGDDRQRPRRGAALPAQDRRPARSPGRGDGADRRRHDRLPLARRADRAGRARADRRRSRTTCDRFVEQWGELLGLGEARRGPYVSSGLVIAGGARGRRGDRAHGRASRRGRLRAHPLAPKRPQLPVSVRRPGRAQRDPADRDRARGSVALDTRLAPTQPFSTLQLGSERWLRPVYPDGSEPILVHHVLPTKPWLQSGQGNVYTQLLSRALAPGLAIEVASDAIPLWLRRTRARATRPTPDRRPRADSLAGRGLYRALLARVRPGPNQTEG